MPADTKKVLWTVFSVGVFLIIVLGVLLVVYYPEPAAANAPLAIGATPQFRGSVSDEYLRAPDIAPDPSAAAGTSAGTILPAAPLPSEASKPATEPEIVIAYGEKPEAGALAPAAGSKTALPASGAADASAIKKTYAPAPSGAVKTAPKPSATSVSTAPAKPKIVAFTEYWIQAASMTSKTRAEELQASLRLKGLSSTILVKDLDGSTWYRVRIGPYRQKSEADGFLTTVRKIPGCTEAFVSKVSGTRTL